VVASVSKRELIPMGTKVLKIHCIVLFLCPIMLNDRNHGCQFLCSVVFPPWSPSSHTYMFGMERSLRELGITGVGDVPVVLRLGDLYFI
jgi:hypothetical protein